MSDAFLLGQKIGKKEGYLILSANNVVLNNENPTATITVTRPGDGKITAVSSNTSVATVTVSGTTLTINCVNDTIGGETTIIVSVAEGTDYMAPASKAIVVSAQLLPVFGTALNDCSWDEISRIAKAGFASSYFEVGDRKAITINGTVGTLSINDTYYTYIIGFNHYDATNAIDFGTFKTALSGGTDICLIDSKYANSVANGTKYFNMNHWGNYNYGGWKGCDLRYDVLGSTDVAPSGYGAVPSIGRPGYDATSTCATSPVPNTLMAALPSELRAVMKPMTIYTDNYGNRNNEASYVTASVDYLPLPAVYEIYGNDSYINYNSANTYEKNYQTQYIYYTLGNSKSKYKHSNIASTADWWTRSVYYQYSSDFCAGSNGRSAYVSFGLTPIFRV